mmetsp:Transcript_3413/g.4953  ORF Transcript_3413/g.4953 Transcript_3413/m.4953 type:complete len:87 (-) Transcript_3413:1052-1312(-)
MNVTILSCLYSIHHHVHVRTFALIIGTGDTNTNTNTSYLAFALTLLPILLLGHVKTTVKPMKFDCILGEGGSFIETSNSFLQEKRG